ncbi:MAG: FG-GAP repeat protein [Bacteriovoracaceae bacterium]
MGVKAKSYFIFLVILVLQSCVPVPTVQKQEALGAKSPTGPTEIKLANPTENSANPRIKVLGNFLIGQTVTLHMDSRCQSRMGSAKVTNNREVIITSSTLDVDKEVTFYADITSRTGEKSSCSDASLGYEFSSGVSRPLVTINNASGSNPRPEVIITNALPNATITIYRDPSCLIQVGEILNASNPQVSTLIDPLTADGVYQFYARQETPEGISACSRPSPEYTLDTKIPSITMLTPIISKEVTPSVVLKGLVPQTLIQLYADPIGNTPCSTKVAEKSSVGTEIELISSPLLQEGVYRFHAKQLFANGLVSPCSNIFAAYQLNTVPGPVSLQTPSPYFSTKPVLKIDNVLPQKSLKIYTSPLCTSDSLVMDVIPTTNSITRELSNSLGSDGVYTFYSSQRISDAPLYDSPCSPTNVTYVLNTTGKSIQLNVVSPANKKDINLRISGIDPLATQVRVYQSGICDPAKRISTITQDFSTTKTISVPIDLAAIQGLIGSDTDIEDGSYVFTYDMVIGGFVQPCSGPSVFATYEYDTRPQDFELLVPNDGPEIFPRMRLKNILTGSTVEIFNNQSCSGAPVATIAPTASEVIDVTIGAAANEFTTNYYSARQILQTATFGYANEPSCSVTSLPYNFNSQPTSVIFSDESAGSNPFPNIEVQGVSSAASIRAYLGANCIQGNEINSSGIVNGGVAKLILLEPLNQEGNNVISVRPYYSQSNYFGKCVQQPASYNLNTKLESITLASGQPDTGPNTRPSFLVKGARVGSRITLHNTPDCSSEVLGSIRAGATLSEVRVDSLPGEGTHTIFARQEIINSAGTIYKSPCTETGANYTLDSKPSNIELITSPSEIDLTPTVRVKGVTPGSVVTLYEGDNCANLLASGQSLTDEITLTVDPARALNAEKTYFFRARQTYNGVTSNCSEDSTSYTLSTTPTQMSIANGLVDPITNIGSEINPVVNVKGIKPGATVLLYKDSSCSLLVGSQSSLSDSVDIVANASLALPNDRSYIFYAKQSFEGYVSPCSSTINVKATYTLKTVPRVDDSGSSIEVTDPFRPRFNVLDTIDNFSVALFSDPLCNNQISSTTTALPGTTSVQISPNVFITEGTYAIYAKQWKDSFESPCSFSSVNYTLDYTPRIFLADESKNNDTLPKNKFANSTVKLKLSNLVVQANISFYSDPFCSEPIAAHQDIFVSNTELDYEITVSSEGNYSFYVRQDHPSLVGQNSNCSESSEVYVYDRRPVIQSFGSNTIGTVLPEITVTNIDPTATNVELYLDPNCTGTRYGVSPSTSINTVDILFSNTIPQTIINGQNGQFVVYARHTYPNSQVSDCGDGEAFILDLKVNPSFAGSTDSLTPSITVTPSATNSIFTSSDFITLHSDDPLCEGNLIGEGSVIARSNGIQDTTIMTLQIPTPLTKGERYTFYAKRVQNGIVSKCSIQTAVYDVGFRPTSLTMQDNDGIYQNNLISFSVRPRVKVEGLISGGKVNIYKSSSSSNCGIKVAESVSIGTEVELLLPALTEDQETVSYYANQIHPNGKSSNCSLANLIYRLDLRPKNFQIIAPVNTVGPDYEGRLTKPIIQVGGPNSISNLNYGSNIILYLDNDCTIPMGSAVVPVAGQRRIDVISNELLKDGVYFYSAKQIASGVESLCSGTNTSFRQKYTLNSSPTKIKLLTLSTVDNGNARLTPSFLVEGVSPNSLVKLYKPELGTPTASKCSDIYERGSTIALDETARVQALPGLDNVASTHQFYAKKIDNAGQGTESGCSAVFAEYNLDPLSKGWEYSEVVRPTNGEDLDFFGSSIDLKGNTMVVAKPGDAGGKGSVTTFTYNGTNWSNPKSLPLPETISSGDRFGTSVSLLLAPGQTVLSSGALLAVGVPHYQGKGAVYIYSYDGVEWKLKTFQNFFSDISGSNGDEYGHTLVLNSRGLLVGVPKAQNGEGRIYFYTLNTSTLQFSAATIISSVASSPNYNFGAAVAMSNDYAVIGEPGNERAYIYDLNDLNSVIILNEPVINGGNLFGHSVSIDANTAVVGAPRSNNSKGSIYVFSGSNFSNREQKTLSLLSAGDGFGWSVSNQGTTIVVGAPFTNNSKGASYILFGSDYQKFQTARDFVTEDSNDSDGDEFGSFVKINFPWLSIAAPKDGGADEVGSVHLFRDLE